MQSDQDPQKVNFYISYGSITDVFIKLIEQFYATHKKCVIYFDSEEEVKFMDAKLWTYGKISFIPHGSRFSLPTTNMADCTAWLTDAMQDYKNFAEILITKGAEVNEHFRQFKTVIEILSSDLNADVTSKVEQYKALGFEKFKVWQNPSGKWESFLGG